VQLVPPNSRARRILSPLAEFMQKESTGGVLMLGATIVALVWANTFTDGYHGLWEEHLTLWPGDFTITEELRLWVNDALMAIFFFVVGLEIKREMVHGELRDPKKAALPAIAALGGMLFPAGIFMLLNAGGSGFDGWGVPMATDIAFAVAVVSLVGNRVPAAAKVFLLTLAIADDIGAIIVIALFYTSDMSFGWLAIAAATLLVAEICKRQHVRAMPVYIALALFAWFAFHETGVHATLAGVILGLLTPAWPFYNPANFSEDMTSLLGSGTALDAIEQDLDRPRERPDYDEGYDEATSRLSEIDRLVSETQSPLDRLENRLHLWVAFVIVPLFAFANAGVRLTSEALDGLFSNRVVLGIVAGLVVGKTVGVFPFTLLGQALGIGTLPAGVTRRTVLGLALTAGVGFTVALFIAGLAYEPGSPTTDSAKIGILAGSLVAWILGYTFLRLGPPAPTGPATAAVVEPTPALTD
jgi:Na+:H+ antiporter, NhaA family